MQEFPTDPRAAKILQQLHQRGYVLAERLSAALHMPLGEYLKTIAQAPALQPDNSSVQLLLECLRTQLRKGGYEIADELCLGFARNPVMQHADHAALLLDQDSFLHNALLAAGLALVGQTVMFSNQCTTISCLSRRHPVAGPTFLRNNNSLYSVFGQSKRLLKDSSFCGLPGPLQFSFEKIESNSAGGRTPLLDILKGQTYPTAPAAYRAANKVIWNALGRSLKVERIGIDEELTCNLALRHIEAGDSAYYRLICDASIRDVYLALRHSFIASDKNRCLPQNSTDHFFYLYEGKLHSLDAVTKGGVPGYVLRGSRSNLYIDGNAGKLIELLRAGLLYPDLLGSYLTKFMLTGAVAIGGTSQQDYVDHYTHLLLDTDKAVSFLLPQERKIISAGTSSRLGGVVLCELNDEAKYFIQHLQTQGDIASLLQPLLLQPVATTIGALSCASYLL